MLVIKVYRNNKWQQIDLAEVTSISLQYNSQMLQFDGILGDFSLPFTLKKTLTNNKIFEYPHKLLNRNQSIKQYQAQLIVNGIVLHTGLISISETDNDTFRANLKLNYSEYSELFNNTKITGNFYGGDKDWVWESEYTDANGYDFALPQIGNEIYFENTESTIKWTMINMYFESQNTYIAQDSVTSGTGSIYPLAICPQPYLYKTLNQLFTSIGINVLDNFFENDMYLKMLLLYNNNDIIYHEIETGETYPYLHYLQKYNLKTCLPNKTISELILSLKNYFCVDFNIKNHELKIIPIQDYLLSSDFIEITDKAINEFSKTKLNSQNIQINLNFGNDTAPNKTDIIKTLTGRFEDAGGNSPHFDPPPELDDVAMMHNHDNQYMGFWKYDFNKFGTKAFVGMSNAKYHPYFQKKADATGTISFNSKAGFLTEKSTSWYSIGAANLQGNTNLHSEVTPFDLKLMIYKSIGKLPNHYTIYAPTASNFLVNFVKPAYIEYTGLSLDLWGLKSVRRKYWDVFINWYGNIPYKLTRKINFSLIDIKNLDFTKKYKIDNQLFFIEDIKLTIDIQGNLKPAICSLLPAD